MKLVLKLLAIVVLLLTSSIVFSQSDAGDDSPALIEYLVSGSSANVRSGPGTNYEIVGTVLNGQSLYIYDEVPSTSGWLRIYQFNGSDDAYIADFLVERAPVRFYAANQDPVAVISGHGRDISDVVELPQGAYRLDVTVNDRSFILQTTVVEGNCDDDTIFNELDFDSARLEMSGLLVSRGCSLIFETDNVDGDWEVAIRDILAPQALNDALIIENNSTISGKGRALTMPTSLEEGIWEVSATVQDEAFILWARPIGECREEAVFNELDFDATVLNVSAVYRVGSGGCIIFWETSNVEGNWELNFEPIR